MQELVMIDNLENTACACTIAEVHAIAEPDWSMQRRWHGLTGRAGLLPYHAVITDIPGMGGIGEIKDFHAPAAPALVFVVCDDVSNARVALPPVLVGGRESREHSTDERRMARVRHIQNLVRLIANRAQQIRLRRIAF